MTNNKIKVTGPEEILKLLTKKLKENGFKENFNLFPAIISALYIDESSFCLKETATNYNVSNTTKTYKALQNWHYLSNLKPEDFEPEFNEEDWVWVTDKCKNASYCTLKKATKEEVKEKLEKEAKKRGFIKGAIADNSNILPAGVKYEIDKESYGLKNYNINDCAEFFVDRIIIMKNGEWAEIVEEVEGKDEEYKFTVSSSGNITTDKFKYQYPLTPNEVFKPTLKIDLNKYNVTIKKEGDNLIVDKELKSFDWEELYKK